MRMLMDFYFITTNRGKLREMERMLKMRIKSKGLELGELQDTDVRRVARDKAMRAYYALRKPVMVEDTGLYIRALNGFPGALVKWLLKGVGNMGMCRIMRSHRDRSAYAETCISLYDGRRVRSFCGRIEGSIAKSPSGGEGFGWDHIFIPNGSTRTFAEMDPEEKDMISHRGRAVMKLKGYLKSIS